MAMKVVTSANMAGPSADRLYERRSYTSRPDAPATHARITRIDPEHYALNYNGTDLVRFEFDSNRHCRLRPHSDGDFQSEPFIQQFMMWSGEPAPLTVSFVSPVEMWNIRPERAHGAQAILLQEGAPLLCGVNGMYFPDWDLLVSWHGLPFQWRERHVTAADGSFTASMTLELGERPLVVLIRPHYYGEHLGYHTHRPWLRRPDPRPITGWCSWEAYHSTVSQEDIRRDAQLLRPLRPYGLTYMQLDDGYQQPQIPPRVGDGVPTGWLELNERFPDGHAGIVSAIRAGGFEPGIWTNAVLNNADAADALNVCLRQEDGSLVEGDWIRYVLDCTPGTLSAQITPYYRALREAGYTYFKSDALRHLFYDGLQEAVRLGLMEPQQARDKMRAYMEAARAGIGEDAYYLSCWGVLTSSIGVADAMRVGTDANPSWSAYSMQLRETARWSFAQRVLFTLDPDHVCVRGELRWVRMMLSLVSLTGGLFMVSDQPSGYDEARVALMQKTMPALAVHTGETGPVDYTTPACPSIPKQSDDLDRDAAAYCHITDHRTPFGSLWCTHFEHGGRQWAVVQRTAVVPLEAAELSPEAFALDPSRQYYAMDFWSGAVYPITGGILSFPSLPLGDTTVMALTDVTDGRPVLLGSDRHVSMDAVSVTEQLGEADSFSMRLAGFAGLTVVYTVYAPGLKGEILCAEGASVSSEKQGELLRVTVHFSDKDAFVRLG